MEDSTGVENSSSTRPKDSSVRSDVIPNAASNLNSSKKTFASKNLNAVIKAPSSGSRSSSEPKSFNSSRLTYLGKTQVSALPPSTTNLSSSSNLRQENNTQDVNTIPLPTKGQTWGGNVEVKTDISAESVIDISKIDRWNKGHQDIIGNRIEINKNTDRVENNGNDEKETLKCKNDEIKLQSKDYEIVHQSAAYDNNSIAQVAEGNENMSGNRRMHQKVYNGGRGYYNQSGMHHYKNNYGGRQNYRDNRNPRSYNSENNNGFHRKSYMSGDVAAFSSHVPISNAQEFVQESIRRTEPNYKSVSSINAPSNESRETAFASSPVQIAADPYSLVDSKSESEHVDEQQSIIENDIAVDDSVDENKNDIASEMDKNLQSLSVISVEQKVENVEIPTSGDAYSNQKRGGGQLYDHKTGKMTAIGSPKVIKSDKIDLTHESEIVDDHVDATESGTTEFSHKYVLAPTDKQCAEITLNCPHRAAERQIDQMEENSAKKKLRDVEKKSRPPRTSGVLYRYEDGDKILCMMDNIDQNIDPFSDVWSRLYHPEENWRKRQITHPIDSASDKKDNDKSKGTISDVEHHESKPNNNNDMNDVKSTTEHESNVQNATAEKDDQKLISAVAGSNLAGDVAQNTRTEGVRSKQKNKHHQKSKNVAAGSSESTEKLKYGDFAQEDTALNGSAKNLSDTSINFENDIKDLHQQSLWWNIQDTSFKDLSFSIQFGTVEIDPAEVASEKNNEVISARAALQENIEIKKSCVSIEIETKNWEDPMKKKEESDPVKKPSYQRYNMAKGGPSLRRDPKQPNHEEINSDQLQNQSYSRHYYPRKSNNKDGTYNRNKMHHRKISEKKDISVENKNSSVPAEASKKSSLQNVD